MDLIYTDTKGKELGVVYTTLDMEIGEEATNDFEIEYKSGMEQSRTAAFFMFRKQSLEA